MAQPTNGDVHVNAPLTNISIAYMQEATAFIADRVFPNIPVTKQSDLYYMYDRGYFNRDEMRERAPGTESAGGSYRLSADDPYFARVYGFHHDIPDQRRAAADSVLAPDREATALVTQKALIKRETNWMGKYFGTGIWGQERAGHLTLNDATNAVFWNLDSSTPIENIRAAKSAILADTGMMPNTLVLGRAVLDALEDHPDIVDRIKYGQTMGGPAIVDTSALSSLFKIPNIVVSDAISNTANEGAAAVHGFISGNNALLTYAAPTPGIMTPSAGYTFSWNGYLGAGAMGSRIKRFRMESLESDRIEINMAFDQKLVAGDLGFFWNSITN